LPSDTSRSIRPAETTDSADEEILDAGATASSELNGSRDLDRDAASTGPISYTPRQVKDVALELVKYGLLEEQRKPNLYWTALAEHEALARVLEPLDLAMRIDEIRGLAYVVVADQAFAIERAIGGHRARMTTSCSALPITASVFRRMRCKGSLRCSRKSNQHKIARREASASGWRLVQLHGGTLEVRSEGVGKGCDFIVQIPRRTLNDAEQQRPAESAPGPLVRRRILIADDNRDAADSLAMLLRIQGHDVTIGHDGRQAVATIDSFRPEVALLDIGMPELNGYEVAQRQAVRSNCPRAQPAALGNLLST
jgi:CheY-like chemotaxis protein